MKWTLWKWIPKWQQFNLQNCNPPNRKLVLHVSPPSIDTEHATLLSFLHMISPECCSTLKYLLQCRWTIQCYTVPELPLHSGTQSLHHSPHCYTITASLPTLLYSHCLTPNTAIQSLPHSPQCYIQSLYRSSTVLYSPQLWFCTSSFFHLACHTHLQSWSLPCSETFHNSPVPVELRSQALHNCPLVVIYWLIVSAPRLRFHSIWKAFSYF